MCLFFFFFFHLNLWLDNNQIKHSEDQCFSPITDCHNITLGLLLRWQPLRQRKRGTIEIYTKTGAVWDGCQTTCLKSRWFSGKKPALSEIWTTLPSLFTAVLLCRFKWGIMMSNSTKQLSCRLWLQTEYRPKIRVAAFLLSLPKFIRRVLGLFWSLQGAMATACFPAALIWDDVQSAASAPAPAPLSHTLPRGFHPHTCTSLRFFSGARWCARPPHHFMEQITRLQLLLLFFVLSLFTFSSRVKRVTLFLCFEEVWADAPDFCAHTCVHVRLASDLVCVCVWEGVMARVREAWRRSAGVSVDHCSRWGYLSIITAEFIGHTGVETLTFRPF